MPDRLLSLVVLVGAWVPPAAAGLAAAEFAHRGKIRLRPALMYTMLAGIVVGWSALWFLFNLSAMPPYIPGATKDPTYAPPKAVAGLVAFASAVVLPASAIACVLAFRRRGRSLRQSSPVGVSNGVADHGV